MKKLLPLIVLALLYLCSAAHAQTEQICVTSPSQTASYNQLCIAASAAGGTVGVTNFGGATGGLGLGLITSGTWNGSPIANLYLLNPFTTINGTTCNLGSTCTISSPSAGLIIGSSTIASGTTNQILYDNGGLVGEITKGNSCLYGTNGTGVPSCLTTLPANLTASSLTAPTLTATNMTVTGGFTATGLVTNADLANAIITVNTVACTLGSSCTISAAASLVVGSTTVGSGTTNQLLYDNGGTLGEVTKGNSCVYGTNGTGVPSCVTTLPFIASLATGGTNANLSASTGGIIYSGASAFAVLAGTATASLPLLSGASAAPTWATISYPTAANSGGIPYFSSATVISSSGVLATSGGSGCIVVGGGAGTAPSTAASNCPVVTNAGAMTIGNILNINRGGDASGSVQLLSGNSGTFALMGIGRTSSEFGFGVAGGSSQFFTGTVAGDSVIYTPSGNQFLGTVGASTVVRIVTSNVLATTIDASQNLTQVGTVRSNTGFNVNGTAGVTKGSGCTITQITGGIITGTTGC